MSSRENSRGQGAGGLSNLEAGTCYGAQGSGGHGRQRRRQGTRYNSAVVATRLCCRTGSWFARQASF